MRLLYFFLCCLILSSGCSSGNRMLLADDAKNQSKPALSGLGGSMLTEQILYSVLLGEIAGQRGRLDVAQSHYLSAAKASKNPKVAQRAVSIAIYAKDNKVAVDAARLWVDFAPEDLDAHKTLASLYLLRGDHKDAIAQLKQVVARAPAGPLTGYLLAASLLSRLQDPTLVLRLMDRLMTSYPNSAEALYAYAWLGEQVKQLDMALEKAEQALLLRPDWAKLVELYGRVLFRNEQKERSLSVLRSYLTKHPKALSIRMTYARELVETKHHAMAREQFQLLLIQSPENTDVMYALALLSMELGDLSAAENYIQTLIQRGERLSEAYFYLGQIGEAQDDSTKAIDAYSKVKKDEYQFEAEVRTAFLYAKMGDLDRTLEKFTELRTRYPRQRVRVYLFQGDALSEAGHDPDAMAIYNQAIEEFPDNSRLLYARGLLGESMNRLDILERDLRQILRKDPDHSDALNALGYTLADRTSRFDEAATYIERALELKPNDAAVIDSMGWLQFRLGNYLKAIQYLSRAYDLVKDTEIAAHLGEVLWVNGDHQQAQSIFDFMLAREPENQRIKDLLERLGIAKNP